MSAPRWSDLPDYSHRPNCTLAHIQKCCNDGCAGEPREYPVTVEWLEFLARWNDGREGQ